jgi:hypothetical protein
LIQTSGSSDSNFTSTDDSATSKARTYASGSIGRALAAGLQYGRDRFIVACREATGKGEH